MQNRVSAVSYLIEPPDLWSSASIPGSPQWISSGPESGWLIGDFTSAVPAWQVQTVLGERVTGSQAVDISTLPGNVFRPEGRLEAQDNGGVDAEVLYPTPQLWGSMALLLAPDVEAACTCAYNDWAADFVKSDPERLVGVAAIPSGSGLDAAVAELRRAANLGMRGALLRAFPTSAERSISTEDDPFWKAVIESNMVLSFDSTFGPSAGGQLSGPRGMATATALTSFVYEGVVERFPELRMVLATPTAGWVPHWLEQTDDLYLRRPGTHNPDLTRRLPSDYLRVRPFFTFSGDDLLLRYPDDYISSSHLMWSSQFPTYHSAESLQAEAGLSAQGEEMRDRVMSTTCRGLYGLAGGVDIDLEPEVRPLVHAIPA